VKERPILFSGPMVRAILEGRKTQTRRVVKSAHALGDLDPYFGGGTCEDCDACFYTPEKTGTRICLACPYGQPGDRLWVKRTHYRFGHWESRPGVKTAAGRMKWRFIPDSEDVLFDAPEVFRRGRHHKDPHTPAWHKRSSLFMPRELAELTLEIVSGRIERLQDISRKDAAAEGICYLADVGWNGIVDGLNIIQNHHWPEENYARLWDSINGKKPGERWKDNPFVWVVEFKVVQP
jgi:hypothetical protein